MKDWMGKVRQLESAIAAGVEGAPRPAASAARQPIETLHAVLDAVEREVLPAGRGRFVFPFNDVHVWLAAATSRDHARLSAAFDGPPSCHERIVERLMRAGCAVQGLSVRTSYVPSAADDWAQPDFQLDVARAAASHSPAAPCSVSRLELTITHGSADRDRYAFDGASVTLGRGAEVRDVQQRLLRTNLVAFGHAGEINQTVSRRHARIEHDPANGAFRLHDDTGADATSVIRDGRGLQVPRVRGLILRSGDVVVLGRARVTVAIG